MKNFSVIGNSKIWLAISSLLVVASLIFIFGFGLKLGLDFTGGSLLEVRTEETVETNELATKLEEQGIIALVQASDNNGLLIRTSELSQEQKVQVVADIEELGGETEEQRFESIGPVIGRELKSKSSVAVAVLAVLIIFYVAYAFRKVSEPVSSWKYGLLTIVAALHDMIIPLGVFAVLGVFADYTVDSTVIAALLTILGYSINDTIVVFDRTRENLLDHHNARDEFADIVDLSVRQSFARSINTSLTTLIVLLAIYFFGGETTQPFVLTLIIGVIAGAYSSIFLASPLLVMWQGKLEE